MTGRSVTRIAGWDTHGLPIEMEVQKELGLSGPAEIEAYLSAHDAVREAAVVVLGVVLSTLHQSTLGTLFTIVPHKLHPLWYSPILPVHFFISCLAAGLAMICFEGFVSWRFLGHPPRMDLLPNLARVMGLHRTDSVSDDELERAELGATPEEIAQALGITVSGAKMKVRRGLLKLVGRRTSLLKYLTRKDRARYKKIIAELGLRK